MDSLVAPRHLCGALRGTGKASARRERWALVQRWRDGGRNYSEIGRALGIADVAAKKIAIAPEPSAPLPPLEAPAHLVGLGSHARKNLTPERVPLLAERWDWIQARRRDGHTLRAIASALAVLASTTGQIARRPRPVVAPLTAPMAVRGLAFRAKAEQREWVDARQADGHGLDAIADALGVTRTHVLRILGRV